MDKIINQLIKKHKTKCPFEISSALGIYVYFNDLGCSTRGLYCRRLRRRFIIIHNRLNGIWKQFVCAHELAHDQLHPNINRFYLDQYSFFNPGKYEQQANKFAFMLLTAGEEIESGETVREFCIRAGVPEEMQQYFIF